MALLKIDHYVLNVFTRPDANTLPALAVKPGGLGMLDDFGFAGGLELRSRTHCGGGEADWRSEAICEDSFSL